MNNPMPTIAGYAPEEIATENQRDYLREMLARGEFDYDEAAYHYICQDGDSLTGQTDMFVRLAYEISQDATLTTAEVSRLTRMVANLAVSVVVFNIAQAGGADERMEAANDAMQSVAE